MNYMGVIISIVIVIFVARLLLKKVQSACSSFSSRLIDVDYLTIFEL